MKTHTPSNKPTLRFAIPEFGLDRVLELRENYVRYREYDDVDWLIQNKLSQHGCFAVRMRSNMDRRACHLIAAHSMVEDCNGMLRESRSTIFSINRATRS